MTYHVRVIEYLETLGLGAREDLWHTVELSFLS